VNPALAAVAVDSGDSEARPVAARDALERWLIEGPARIATGPHAGAMAGESVGGRARYAYPEITGYYLQWLAHRAHRHGHTEILALRARDAQRWLKAWISESPLPARVHIDAAVCDWRNDATFAFDLAMVLRGVASAADAGLVVADAFLVGEACEHLRTLIAVDGQFDAARPHAAAALLPTRWSTRRGAFLTKAAAGVLAAARSLAQVPRAVQAAAEATWDASLDALLCHPHAALHPYLYAIEGLLSLPAHPRFDAACEPVARELQTRLAARRCGTLPESLESPGRPRLDIVAHALRAVLLLTAHGVASAPVARAVPALIEAVCANLEDDGGLRFAPDDPPTLRNAWTCMFAEQALDYAACGHAELASIATTPWIV